MTGRDVARHMVGLRSQASQGQPRGAPASFRELFGVNQPPEPQFPLHFEEEFGTLPRRVSPVRGRQRRLDPTQALRLYDQGLTNFEIAEAFGVTPLRVSQVLRSAGVRRPRGGPSRIPRDEVIRLHNEGMHPREIGVLLGASTTGIVQILRQAGLEPHVTLSKRADEVARRHQQVLELHRQGLAPMHIVSETGLSLTGVYGILRQAGLAPNIAPETLEVRREAQRVHQEIVRLHRQGVSNTDIARQFGITHQNVSVHLQSLRPAPPMAPGAGMPPLQRLDRARAREFENRAFALLPEVQTLWVDLSEENIRAIETAMTDLWNETGEYVARAFWWEGDLVVWADEESRWRAAFVRDRLGRAIEELDTLRGCLLVMSRAQETGLPRVIGQARDCILRATYLVVQCCPEPPLPSPLRVQDPIPGLVEEEEISISRLSRGTPWRRS